MEIRTFKPQFRDRAPGYRTPSPPAVEFFVRPYPHPGAAITSPPLSEFQAFCSSSQRSQIDDLQYKKGHKSTRDSNGSSEGVHESHLPAQESSHQILPQDSPSRLDIFAAVATSPRNGNYSNHKREQSSENGAFHWNHNKTIPHSQWRKDVSSLEGRPPKRLRIEHEDSGGQTRTHSGHIYSPRFENNDTNGALYDQNSSKASVGYMHSNASLQGFVQDSLAVSDTSIADAELLLSFAQSSVYRNSQLPYAPQSHSALTLFSSQNSKYFQGENAQSTEYGVYQRKSNLNFNTSPSSKNPTHELKRFEESHLQNSIGNSGIRGQMSTSEPNTTSTVPSESKPRVHKGWPKGKPRGTRQAPSKMKKVSKPNEKVRQGRKPKNTISKSSRNSGPSIYGMNASHEELAFTKDSEVLAKIKEASQRRLSMPDVCHAKTSSESRNRHLSAPPDIDERVFSLTSSADNSATYYTKSSLGKTATEPANICAACNSSKATVNGYKNLWIGCDGCKKWFHYVCAGFQNQREVRDVDKFYCKECEHQHGPTTTVRKSSRAHTALDYAGLNEGVIRTSDDVLEHHFIKSIKTKAFQFDPETFPRMRPELVTAEYFESCGGMPEPILIPASLNPPPSIPNMENDLLDAPSTETANWFSDNYEYDCVFDDGQDKLDMVIPRGLTVRQVADICGQEEKIDVIDVKNQTGEDKRWNLRQWADYYEAEGEKPVRNVISLEFSWSKLSKLVRRPKIARDLDLQDLVWPAPEYMKGNSPKSVQYYCLMSVADCYTDFHIDFGGSSVYYHILKGKKTFFFIPPKSKHLKKYEEWCNSKDQNNTWLPDLTQECYRVDLSVGDTMIIPSGWIHAVWTPENSLVIGGNFLTRMHYAMQIRINEIEKATKMALKFRYPMFQRVMWFAVIDYLKTDPVPSTVVEILYSGAVFSRRQPVWYRHDIDENQWDCDPDQFNARFYCQGEIEGLGALLDYILRTVRISMGKIDGVTKETQGAVIRSLPKGYGDHLDILKTFAIWVAWKRGNELLPSWAFPAAALPDSNSAVEKALSATAQKKRARQAAHVAWMAASDRRSRRSGPQQKKEGDADLTVPSQVGANSQDTVHSLNFSQDDSRPFNEEPEQIKERLGIRVITKPQTNPDTQTAADKEHPTFAEDDPMSVESSASNTQTQHYDTVIPQVNSASDEIKSEFSQQSLIVPPSSSTDEALVNSSKPSRAKACDECRRSKRRCIHDENGQINASKMLETPVRRGPNKPKPTKPGYDNDTTGSHNKLKTDPQVTEVSNVSADLNEIYSAVNQDIHIPRSEVLETQFPVEPAVSLDEMLDVQHHEILTTKHLKPGDSESESAGNSTVNETRHVTVSPPQPDIKVHSTKDMDSSSSPFESDNNEELHVIDPGTNDDSNLDDTRTPNPMMPIPDLVRSAEHQDISLTENSNSESKSRTSSPRLPTNSTERTSHSGSRSSSPLTEVEISTPVRVESPDELGMKAESTINSGFAPRKTKGDREPSNAASSSRLDPVRNVSTRVSSLSTTKASTIPIKRPGKASPSSKTSAVKQTNGSANTDRASTKARTSSASSDEDWKLALQLAAEERGLRRRG